MNSPSTDSRLPDAVQASAGTVSDVYPSAALFAQNAALFAARFPELSALYAAQFAQAPQLPESWQLLAAKNGSVTVKEDGVLLHSAYAPEKEAAQQVQQAADASCTAGIFCAFGLGYAPDAFAAQYPDKQLILIEPDAARLAAAFSLFGWERILRHPRCMLILGAAADTTIHALDTANLSQAHIFRVPAHIRHAQQYFDTLGTLIARNQQKQEINRRTAQAFAPLWLKNSAANMSRLVQLAGAASLENAARPYPACILAAGPSLADALPFLPQLKERSLLICVDTALRACLRRGVQPDVVVTADPQYWNSRHLAGLASPGSLLITELAAYPSVFRFPCRAIRLFSSPYPPGVYIERHGSPLGTFSPGGSVASAAWEFARFAGCGEIYIAGLDLGFPSGQTHVAGSLFEEQLHARSNRLHTAQTETCAAVYTENQAQARSYDGNTLYTDSRMKLYAWWFESRIAAFPAVRTYTFSPRGMEIPGIAPVPLTQFIQMHPAADRSALEAALFADAPPALRAETLAHVRKKSARALKALQTAAEQALSLCRTALSADTPDMRTVCRTLTKLNADMRARAAGTVTECLCSGELLPQCADASHADTQRQLHKAAQAYERLARTAKLSRRLLCLQLAGGSPHGKLFSIPAAPAPVPPKNP